MKKYNLFRAADLLDTESGCQYDLSSSHCFRKSTFNLILVYGYGTSMVMEHAKSSVEHVKVGLTDFHMTGDLSFNYFHLNFFKVIPRKVIHLLTLNSHLIEYQLEIQRVKIHQIQCLFFSSENSSIEVRFTNILHTWSHSFTHFSIAPSTFFW